MAMNNDLTKPLIKDSGSDGVATPRDDSPSTHTLVTEAEQAIVNRVLDACDKRAKTLKLKGLSTWGFCAGVSNVIFITWVFGAHPEHIWLVYLFEVAVLFPIRWKHQAEAKPLKETYFWFDFCWFANFVGVFGLILLVANFLLGGNHLTTEQRIYLFSATWGIACGPLLLATGLLGNSLLFHDVDNVASCLIHLFPSLVLYTIMWNRDALRAAWPEIFHLDYIDTLDPWTDIYCNAAKIYTSWLVVYTLWLITCGMSMPAKGYDTVFHYNMRGPSKATVRKILCKTGDKSDNFTIPEVLVYMAIHACMVYPALLVSIPVFKSKVVHGLLCALMVFMTIYNASNRYKYYMLHSYSDSIRKELQIPFDRRASALPKKQ